MIIFAAFFTPRAAGQINCAHLSRDCDLAKVSEDNLKRMESKMIKLKRPLMIVTIIAAANLMVACSAITPTETHQGQPTAIADFKSVARTWEGFLTSNDPKMLNYDRASLV